METRVLCTGGYLKGRQERSGESLGGFRKGTADYDDYGCEGVLCTGGNFKGEGSLGPAFV
jgi:hypothetical protein